MKRVNVQITPDTAQKFVLAYGVSKNEEDIILLWGNPKAEWHKDIVDEIASSGFTISRIVGGGRINAQSEAKKVHVWGGSSRYGAVTLEEIHPVLEDVFPSYEQIFESLDD